MIREKFDIFAFRIIKENKLFVGKYFNEEQMHGKKEIQPYEILKKINVPTLNSIAQTDCIILLEDIDSSDIYRLGTEEDISDVRVARCIGKWVKKHFC